MATNQEVIRISKREFDSLCPYCKSRAVYLVGLHRAEVEAPGSHCAFAGGFVEDWSCAICYRSFELA